MAMCIGSAMKEDLREEAEKYEDSPMSITSSMKEDLQYEEDRMKDGSTIVGSDNK